jgi:hypothetical protein
MELWLTPTTRREPMDLTIVAEIEALRQMKVRAFRTRYLEVFGEESRSSNKQFLFRRIAWRLQANGEGDLSKRTRQRALDLADDADLRIRAPDGFFAESGRAYATEPVGRTEAGRDRRLPSAGALLTRQFENRRIVVKVLKDGFEYQPQQYRSLSAIAREVTGTRWNGLLFLELLERRNGATLKEIMKATGWQSHSVRGFLSGTLRKKLGVRVDSVKRDNNERTYEVSSK